MPRPSKRHPTLDWVNAGALRRLATNLPKNRRVDVSYEASGCHKAPIRVVTNPHESLLRNRGAEVGERWLAMDHNGNVYECRTTPAGKPLRVVKRILSRSEVEEYTGRIDID